GLRVHAAGEHVAVVSVRGDKLVAVFRRHLDADDDRLLADVKMTEAGDDAHAVELPRLLLEAANEQHIAIGGALLVEREGRRSLWGSLRAGRHPSPAAKFASGNIDQEPPENEPRLRAST